MIKNEIYGAETCKELLLPHFKSPFQVAAYEQLEGAIVANESVSQLGGALEYYYRMSDVAGNQIDYDTAPQNIKNLSLCLRDAAEALIRQAGVDPEIFNQPPVFANTSSSLL